MDEISKHDFQPETPCIKVVGVGETMAPIIESLKEKWGGFISAEMAGEFNPEKADKMVIIVSDGNAEATRNAIKASRETLTIVAVAEDAMIDSLDVPVLKSTIPNMQKQINEIITPIIHTGTIGYSFDDFEMMVRGCNKIVVETAKASGKSRFADTLSLLSPGLGNYSKYSVILYYNPNDEHHLIMAELQGLTQWIENLPKNMEVVWVVYQDYTLSDGNVKLTVITAR